MGRRHRSEPDVARRQAEAFERAVERCRREFYEQQRKAAGKGQQILTHDEIERMALDLRGTFGKALGEELLGAKAEAAEVLAEDGNEAGAPGMQKEP